SSKPASGTSRASTRSGDPARLTRAPRALSASATARAGSTCPAVPPAAIRHAGALRSAILRDVKEDADRDERDYQARAAVGDERERDPRERREPHHRGEVDRGLPADDHRETGGEPLAEGVLAGERDPEPCVGEGRVRGDHEHRADQPELLADD